MPVTDMIATYKSLPGDQKQMIYRYLYESQSQGGSSLPADAPAALQAWVSEYDALSDEEQDQVHEGVANGGRRRKTKKAGRRKTKKAGRRRKTKKGGNWKY